MAKTRVLVVDDSAVIRRLITEALTSEPEIEVVGTAANGRIALAKIPRLRPDVVTLDLEMPVMDGLETLDQLRSAHPGLPVIMFSTLTERGASATLTALERGARDYVTKPGNVSSLTDARDAIRFQLVPKILGLDRQRATESSLRAGPTTRPASALGATGGRDRHQRVDVVVVGSSTGGPDALATLVPALPVDFPVPVLVTQHMPPVFTRQFAARLDSKAALRVAEATDGQPVEPGTVLIAPGNWHMRARRTSSGVRIALDQGAQENFCRPAVDALFRSAAEAYGAHVLGVVLTGMGSDGALGALEIARCGGGVLAQDEETSVVWGMPGAAAATGTVSHLLPLHDIAAALVDRVAPRPGPGRGELLSEGARA